MIIDIFAKEVVVRECLTLLDSLPEEYKPLFFSEAEAKFDKNNRWEDKVNLKRFIENNSLGFYLRSKSCVFNFSFSGEDSSIFIEIKRKQGFKDAATVIKKFSQMEVAYGYACIWDERLYRNGTKKDFGVTTIESWIGRDFRRYLPGLYWANIISKSALEGINSEKILKYAFQAHSFDGGNSYIQMFEKPNDWENYAPVIDDICSTDENIFFKWDLWEEHLDQIDSEKEYEFECSKWP